MGYRKPYRKPALSSFGDIREVTRMPVKNFGGSDTIIMLQDEHGNEIPTHVVS